MTALRLGTRGSRLALVQSELVATLLRESHAGIEIELVTIESAGDRDRTTPLTSGSGAGWFTTALQEALRKGEVDFLVHSYKDLPTARPDGLEIVAVPARADPRDALVSASGATFAGLPAGAIVGTSSPRRMAQLRERRPDLEYRPIRGNVDTRIAKVDGGEFHATVLALAGLDRLGLAERAVEVFAAEDLVPAPAQGALAVECRTADSAVREILSTIENPQVRVAVDCERAFLRELEAGCSFPAGAHAMTGDAQLRLIAFTEFDGVPYHGEAAGPDGTALAVGLARRLTGR